jgi:hypothetical protein
MDRIIKQYRWYLLDIDITLSESVPALMGVTIL